MDGVWGRVGIWDGRGGMSRLRVESEVTKIQMKIPGSFLPSQSPADLTRKQALSSAAMDLEHCWSSTGAFFSSLPSFRIGVWDPEAADGVRVC